VICACAGELQLPLPAAQAQTRLKGDEKKEEEEEAEEGTTTEGRGDRSSAADNTEVNSDDDQSGSSSDGDALDSRSTGKGVKGMLDFSKPSGILPCANIIIRVRVGTRLLHIFLILEDYSWKHFAGKYPVEKISRRYPWPLGSVATF